jgi:outer membrane receptor protein involved in Fe transport
MRKIYPVLFCSLISLLSTAFAYAQTTVSGKVTDAANQEPLAGVNIVVKGRVVGTITDGDGNFSLKINEAPPITLVVSFVGYRSFEVSIANANTSGLDIKLEEQTILGQEIVVSASRVEESILESPVSIEKMDILQVQNTPADNYYKGLANLKGVDVTTSSINFQILNARGFGSTGNTRFVQLTDGMDTQAPALNFPIGNLNGPSELDVESVEMLPGASSALYGPNAFNGIVLVNSKNPFEYQGLSAMVKSGINHVGSDADFDGPSPIWEGAIRYAKSFNNKFAFKANFAYMKAEDWHGTDQYDREADRKASGISYNTGSDKLHYMGDEAAINMAIFPFSSSWQTFANTSSTYYNNIFEPGVTALTYANAGDLPNHVVSVTPYAEKDLINYNAENMKINLGAFYRINDKLELSALYNGGFGTSVYTGAQRYSLSDFSINQYRLQLRGDNFYVRAYTTMENSGDSYITEFLAKRINDLAVNQANPLFQDVSGFLATYATEYLRYLYNNDLAPGEINTLAEADRNQMQEAAHNYARGIVDGKFHPSPDSENFQRLKERAGRGTVPQGPRFNDKTNLYHGEFQYDLKNQIDFMELQVGGSYRMFDLNSNGTIFDDGVENITIKEYGAYAQAGKWLGDRRVKLSGSVRYDKNQNFKGRVNPRISAVIKAGQNHNFRISYQTGFRIPSTQGQHIDLNTISVRLLGGLQRYADKYQLPRTSTVNPATTMSWEASSVEEFRRRVFSTGDFNSAVQALVPYTNFDEVKPEQVKSVEVGYKSVISDDLLIDLSYYYNTYNDFITSVVVITAEEYTTNAARNNIEDDQFSYTNDATLNGTPNYATLLNSSAHSITGNGIDGNTSSIYSNAPGTVTAQGAVLGLTYNLPKGYTLTGNYNWNTLGDVPTGFIAEFNTPEHKVNFSFGNRKLIENLGFNVTWRWQTAFDWQSSFTNYTLYPVPAYNTIDAQISYKVPNIKSTIKVGGSNILNSKYLQSGGGPNISGLYYISLTYDELFR